MSRRPATVLQADVARVLRAAWQTGAAEVEVEVGGVKTVIRRGQAVKIATEPLPAEKEIVL